MNGAWWQKNLKCLQNEDWSQTLGYSTQPAAGFALTFATAISFAGATAKMEIRQNQLSTSTLLLTLTTSSGLTFGTTTSSSGIPYAYITIAITNAQTVLLPAGEWFYDILMTQSGAQSYIAQGIFEVGPTATR